MRSLVRLLTPVGLVGVVVGVVLYPERAAFSYLSAYLTLLSTLIGSAMLVMLAHASNARWFIVLRRSTEILAATLPLAALGVIPLLLWMPTLYEWSGDLSSLSHHHRQLVEKKQVWLNAEFFLARSVIYVVLLAVIGEALFRFSLKQDEEKSASATQRAAQNMARLSVVGLVITSLVCTVLSFAWIMTLDPVWYSNVYGVYVFSGGMVSSLSLLCGRAALDVSSDSPSLGASREHLYAGGRLLFGFVCFWAYIAFSQALLIWIADLPEEVGWYVRRTHGGWEAVTWLLILGHFALPFAYLLPKKTKTHPGLLLLACSWMLIMHHIDCLYQVVPEFGEGEFSLHFLDVLTPLTFAGVFFELFRLRSAGVPPIPQRDPRLDASLSYESP